MGTTDIDDRCAPTAAEDTAVVPREAWQQLVQTHLALAEGYARCLRRRLGLPRCVDAEELRSDAYWGLVQAAQGFQRQRACRFWTYAAPRVWGAMLDGLRNRRVLKTPRGALGPQVLCLDDKLPVKGRYRGTVAESMADAQPPVGFHAEQADQIDRILAPLNRDGRRLLRRRYVEDVPATAIAQSEGCSVSLIRGRLARLKQKVRMRAVQ